MQFKSIKSDLRSLKTVNINAIVCVGFERQMLTSNNSMKSFNWFNQCDTGSMRNGLIFGKISKPKNIKSRKVILEGHSNNAIQFYWLLNVDIDEESTCKCGNFWRNWVVEY